MDNSAHLTAVRIPDDEVGLYSVSESGWYAIGDDEKAVLGPFASLGECDRAIRERVTLMAPSDLADLESSAQVH